jgi:hypothetical protein
MAIVHFNGGEERSSSQPCQIAELSTDALGDYAVKRNSMKEQYALRLGLQTNRSRV